MKPGISAVGGSGRGWVQGLARAPDGALWAVLYRATVLRSTDGGDTWTEVPSPTTRWLTDIAVTPDGAVLIGDEKGALHETRDHGQNWEHTPRGPEAEMLHRVLVAWRATRHPTLAVLIDALGARCASPSPPTAQAPWMALAQACRPEDLNALTATWLDATMDEASVRLDALLRFDDDPRVARALAAFVRDFAFGATSSKPLWTAVGAKLVALRDPHTAVVVGAASQRTIPVKGATMKTWLARYLPRLADELDAACAPTPELDAANRALCAEAERLLR